MGGGFDRPQRKAAFADFERGLAACLALEAVNCKPGHPMADL